jgi:hypothetical protein
MPDTIATCEPVWKRAIGCFFAISALLQCACSHGRREGNMDTLTPPLAVETEALRKRTPHSTETIFQQPLSRSTLKSSGPSLPSFREAELIADTRESRRTCRSRARTGLKEAVSRSGSLSLAIRSLCLFMRERGSKTAQNGMTLVWPMSSPSAMAKPFKCVLSLTGGRLSNGPVSKPQMRTDPQPLNT